jgi:hypothetical protein
MLSRKTLTKQEITRKYLRLIICRIILIVSTNKEFNQIASRSNLYIKLHDDTPSPTDPPLNWTGEKESDAKGEGVRRREKESDAMGEGVWRLAFEETTGKERVPLPDATGNGERCLLLEEATPSLPATPFLP